MNAQKSLPSVAWVVGVGPSNGLGAALARRFAQGGSTAVVTGRNNARLESVAAEIRDSDGNAIALAGDVGVPAEVERLASALRSIAQSAAREYGPTGICTNNPAAPGHTSWN